MKPKHLIISGITLLIICFLYSIIVVNIPPQDMTPRLFNDYNFHASVSEWIGKTALIPLAAGVIWYFIQKM